MSEFDKEAEREKLRRKYEAEQEDRQATQRMSELLLQGATMTNHHCDACGSPIFRYEGQEFCPSCQAAGGGVAESAAAGSEPEGESPEPSDTAPESEAEARRFADEQRAEPTDTASQPSEVRGADATEASDPTPAAEAAAPTDEPRPTTHANVDPGTAASGDLADARNALAETITRLARRASNAEDPRRAREFLEAAGEAATVLETLEGR